MPCEDKQDAQCSPSVKYGEMFRPVNGGAGCVGHLIGVLVHDHADGLR